MATGDQQDMMGRIRSALPNRWFPLTAPGAASVTPILDGVLAGLSQCWAWFYGLYSYVNEQTRLLTSTDVWIDLFANDFLGSTLPREVNEGDEPYRLRVQQAIIAPRATREAISQAVTNLTGQTPKIFQPRNTYDTGGYNLGGVGYNTAGGYGNLNLGFQFFITVYLPAGGGVANVGSYGNLSTFNVGAGGYGVGAIEYVNTTMVLGQVTNAAIYTTVANAISAGNIAWTAITNG